MFKKKSKRTLKNLSKGKMWISIYFFFFLRFGNKDIFPKAFLTTTIVF